MVVFNRNRPLSNMDIERVLSKRKGYVGVFMRDEIPEIELFNNEQNFGIINLDDSSNRGTHWTAFFIDTKKRTVVYFDPYGFNPPEEFVDFSNNVLQGYKRLFSVIQFQADLTATCGWWCIFFIEQMHLIKSQYDLIKFFEKFLNSDPNANEVLLKRYFG